MIVPIFLTFIVDPSDVRINEEWGEGADVVNEVGWGVMWLQQAELKSQGEEVSGKIERTKEDALPKWDRTTWLTIASKSAVDKVTLDPDAWPEEATEEGAARDEPLLVWATAAIGAVDLPLHQHLSIVCPWRRQ